MWALFSIAQFCFTHFSPQWDGSWQIGPAEPDYYAFSEILSGTTVKNDTIIRVCRFDAAAANKQSGYD